MDNIRDKIRKLLRLAENAGATEAEALNAAAKARALMDEYQVTVSAADLEETGAVDVTDEAVILGKAKPDRIIVVSSAIARFCDVKVWKSGPRVVFLGLSADVEMASYLLRLVRTARDAEWKSYQRSDEFRDQRLSGWTAYQLRKSFTDGMAIRIGERLKALKAESEAAFSNSRALVPVKNALITEEMARRGIFLRRGRRGSGSYANAARDAGRAAGDRVSLTRPVGSAKVAGALR